jgi:FKBP-type peptidyl-prolyl cis-trans isomerase 2
MVIGEHTVVVIHFTLRNNGGKVLENTVGKKPLEFIYGTDMVVPGLEKALEGLKAGDKKTVVISPSEGYGLRDKNLVLKIHRDELPEQEIKVGQEFHRGGFSDEETELFRVSGFIDDWIYLDKNHPWAGEELHYEVDILEVRPDNRYR